jgi:Lrp/AsnC family transcriptional regulator for asnA, asnC and gidA
MLQEDGRLPYATIGQKLRVSEGTVRNRVHRMMEARVLRILAVADPLALGYTGYAMLGLKFAAGSDPDALGESFRRLSEVTYVLLVAGRYDMLVEVICETQTELREFIVRHCYRNASVAAVEAMMGLATYKNLLKWGQP